MSTPFDDWYYEQCCTDAAELVGPNGPEYDAVCERFLDDPERTEAARVRYMMLTGLWE